MTGFEHDEYHDLGSNFYINESSNIFKIRLFSTNADFICDNHVQLTQLFTSSALLAQSPHKISCLYNLSYVTSSHEIASLGLCCCIHSGSRHKMHSLLISCMGMYGAFSIISFISFIINLVPFSELGVLYHN